MPPVSSRMSRPDPLTLLALLLAAGCAGLAPSPLAGSSSERWVAAVHARRVDPGTAVNPIAWTEAMRVEAERLAGRGSTRERLRALQDGLFDPSRFPFAYESRGTFTAAEAFAARRGNCLSFTCLFIAMARSIGIDARAASPEFAGRAEREGDLVVVNTHVVAAHAFHEGLEIYDFDLTRERRIVGARVLDDLRLGALYANNLGVDHLRTLRLDDAEASFEVATKLSPDFVAAWSNLGVARRRAGRLQEALEAYRRALEIEPKDASVLGNLATLYRTLGNEREARNAIALASLSGASPHFLIVRGDLERVQGNPSRALRLYRRAHRMAPSLADPLVSIASAELDRGRDGAARDAAREALELDPSSADAKEILDRASGGGR